MYDHPNTTGKYSRSYLEAEMDVNVEGAVAEHHIRPPLRSPAKPDGVCVGAAGTHYRDIGIDFTAGCISGCTGIAVGQVWKLTCSFGCFDRKILTD